MMTVPASRQLPAQLFFVVTTAQTEKTRGKTPALVELDHGCRPLEAESDMLTRQFSEERTTSKKEPIK